VTTLLPEQRVGGLAVPASLPYPWPYDETAAPGRTALLVVAVQAGLEALCAATPATLALIAALTEAARRWGAPVIATRHAASPAQHRPGILAPAGDAAWELISPQYADTVIDCYGVDGFSASPLAEYLAGAGIDHLLICGLGLEGPVHSTLRSANDRGLECLLVIDGCAPLDAALADAGIRIIEMSGGIFGAVATGDAVLTAFHHLEV
jgi:nicotinamidase-related amidase